MTTGITVMSGELGDIFWDLAPWITYEPGYDLGCSIYVANPTDTEKEYALMSRLSQTDAVISEEVLPVFGHSWFKVEPGDFVRLRGALRFAESDGDLAILLIERETEEVADSVVTVLVSRRLLEFYHRPGRAIQGHRGQPASTGAWCWP